MNGDPRRALEAVFRRLRELGVEVDDRADIWLDPDAQRRERLPAPAVESLLHEIPAWSVIGDADAIERSMQLGVLEEGLILLIYLATALAGWAQRTRFRATWEQARVTIRLWGRDGRQDGGVTAEVIALAWKLEDTLFPLRAPAEGDTAAGRQPAPGFSDDEPS